MPTISYRLSVAVDGRRVYNEDSRVARRTLQEIDNIRRMVSDYLLDIIPEEIHENSRPIVITSEITREELFGTPYADISFLNRPEYTNAYLRRNFDEIEPVTFDLGFADITFAFDLRQIYEGDYITNETNINDINYINYNHINEGVNNENNENNNAKIINIEVNRNYVDPISQNSFEEGENAIRLQKNDRYVFKPEGIQQWMRIARTNPLTRKKITNKNMQKGKIKFKNAVGGTRVATAKRQIGSKYKKTRKNRRVGVRKN